MSNLNPSVPQMDFDSIGEFCFESDILALKGNDDYKNVLEAIVILEAQREQALKDLDNLLDMKKKALDDPLEFVEKLKQKDNLDIPSAQIIYPVPSIDWGKYALSGDPAVFKKRQLSRIAAEVKKNFKRKNRSPVEEIWTKEEEKNLDELLIKFPPEKNQNARWEKIADCLGSHSAAQVSAKVKNCFPQSIGDDTLFTENILPQTCSKRKAADLKEEIQHRNENTCHSESLCTDDDSLDKIDISDDEISPELLDTAEYQELLLYKRLLKKRIKSSLTQHFGYKCYGCKSEPIIGVRYYCGECIPPINLCEDCASSPQEIGEHNSYHKMEEILQSNAGYLDRDYMHFLGKGNDYNYLDPNYMPAA